MPDAVEIDDTDDIESYLRSVLRRLVDGLRAHPDVAHLAASRILACDKGMMLTDQVLGRLRGAGVPDRPSR